MLVLIFIVTVYASMGCMCVNMRARAETRSGQLEGIGSLLHLVGHGDGAQVSKYLIWLRHLVGPSTEISNDLLFSNF